MAVITGINSVISGEINNARVLKAAGAPTANVTGLGQLSVGDFYVNTTTGVLSIVTATNGTSTIAFATVGAQT